MTDIFPINNQLEAPLLHSSEVVREKIRVIIADDHPIIRAHFHQLLKSSPQIQVVGEASNGEETLRQVRKLLPDVLLLDIEMPVLSGIEVAHVLHQELPKVKILAISAYTDVS